MNSFSEIGNLYGEIFMEARSSHGDRKAVLNLVKKAMDAGLIDIEEKKKGFMIKSLVDDSQLMIHRGENDFHYLRRYIQQLENLPVNA
jgi:hypothetical protein